MTIENPQRHPEAEELLTICASEYCQVILSYFDGDAETTATISEIVDETDPETQEQRERIAIHLHHVAAPRLAAVGYLDYDGRTRTIRYRGRSELEGLATHLDTLNEP